MNVVTTDLSKFGYREIREAIELLEAYLENTKDILGDGLTLNFNTHSGCVFLSDEDYRIAMINNGNLEEWFYCGECGAEGFLEDIDFVATEQLCKDCFKRHYPEFTDEEIKKL